MEKLKKRALELMGEAFSCSQIIVMLSHEERNTKNPEIIRALGGLGGGMCSQRACGTLTGGSCLIGSFGAKGDATEEPKFPYRDVVKEFLTWFEKEFGSIDCKDLVSLDRADRLKVCPDIISKSYEKCVELLKPYGLGVN